MRKPTPPERRPYPDPDRPGVCRLPLTQGRVAIIDAADAEVVGLRCWQWTGMRGNVVSAHHRGDRAYQLRHVLTGASADACVVHRNDDKLDFRRDNLIVTSKSFTRCRDPKKRRNPQGGRPASQFKGVYWNKAAGKWTAMLRGKYLGVFRDERAAAAAYDDEMRATVGPVGRYNFPRAGEVGIASDARPQAEGSGSHQSSPHHHPGAVCGSTG